MLLKRPKKLICITVLIAGGCGGGSDSEKGTQPQIEKPIPITHLFQVSLVGLKVTQISSGEPISVNTNTVTTESTLTLSP